MKLPKMTKEDRKHVFDVADFFLELNIIARREGILTLDDYCENKDAWIYGAGKLKPLPGITQHEHDVFHMLLTLGVNAAEKETIQEVARNFINSSDEIGGAQLALMIGAEAITSIISFESTDKLRIRLASMMNWPFCTEYYDGNRNED